MQSNTQAVTQNSASPERGQEHRQHRGECGVDALGKRAGIGPADHLTDAFVWRRELRTCLPAQIPYTSPAPLRLDLGDTTQANTGISGFAPVVYGQNGLPRLATRMARRGHATPVAGPQISIQVNALDSRSFMDHSDEIAQAVRQAMLNSHSLNDVVNDI